MVGARGRVAGWNASAFRDRPALLLFGIAAVPPSLGRQWLFQAFNQFQFEKGSLKAVAALCDQAMGFTILNGRHYFVCPVASGVAQGCPLSGTTWAMAMGFIIGAVNAGIPSSEDGRTGACAVDLGLYLQRMSLLVPLAGVFHRAAALGNLHLN
eukprot:3110099-Pyramimonas_sp.AAC.1